jgi:hypothetical protein
MRAALPEDLSVDVDIAIFYEGQVERVELGLASLRTISEYGAALLVTIYYRVDEGAAP